MIFGQFVVEQSKMIGIVLVWFGVDFAGYYYFLLHGKSIIIKEEYTTIIK